MSERDPAAPVSRARYERERRARAEAEALLETKSRELFEASRRLVLESEAVRAALAETHALRAREAEALEEQSILSGALAALSGRDGAAEAMQALLETLRSGFSASLACYVQAAGPTLRIAASAGAGGAGTDLPVAAGLIDRPRRIAGLAALADGRPLPGRIADCAAVLVAPLRLPEEAAGALLLGATEAGGFSAARLRLLDRVAAVATPALTALRAARRNALLVSLIEGRPIAGEGGVLDTPLEAVHRAFARLTDMQGEVVGVLDALLGAPLAEADAAIEAALARMGALTRSDRVHVVRFSDDGDAGGTSHAWRRRGARALREGPEGIPAATMAAWREAFGDGRDVLIPDVTIMPDDAPEKAILLGQGVRSLFGTPMIDHGALRGIVCYETATAQRSLLPGEVYLIRSVARVIATLLARRDAEAALHAANAETEAERARLQSVLAAMPDLLIELDRDGQTVGWRSGEGVRPAAFAAGAEGRTPEQALPEPLAAHARAMTVEIDAGRRPQPRVFAHPPDGDAARWWQVSASALAERGYLLVLRDVTEARAQTALIERLSEIARRTTNLVVVTDAERRIEWVNAAFERATGWRLDEVRGDGAGRLLQCEATDPATVARLRAALDAGEAIQAEILNRARDGRHYWVALDIQPLRDAAGALQGFMAVEIDVTERRAQADALRAAADDAARARATLEAAVGALQDGFALYDAEDRLVICNERYRQVYPRSAEAIRPGETFEAILRAGLALGEYADAVGREEDWLAERLARHRAPYNEVEQRLSDGRWLRVFEKATPDGGRVGLRVDITALKRAEQRALADRSAAMEASQDGIAITDAEGRFVYMNRAHLALFGFDDEAQVIGRPWSILYAPDAARWMEANALPALRRTGRWSGEIMGRARDGAPVDQDVSLTLKDDGGILCIVRDMLFRRREAEERERLREELRLSQRREIIGRTAAGLAHDFNNLLAAISGGAALIEAGAEAGGVAAAGAARIQKAADQAAGLVRRLLSLGARPQPSAPLDMRKTLVEAGQLVRAGLRAPARLRVETPDAPMMALADATDVLQVALNLAINARDALGGAAGEIVLALSEARSDDLAGPFVAGAVDPRRPYLLLSVRDDGPGMTPELAAQVFRPYFTTKGDEGSGLGLAVVASVVTAHGGAVRLDTAPGRGARFDVLWPAADGAAPTAAGAVDGLSGRLDGRAVLVVDDDHDVLATHVAILEAAGAEVAPSTDPADALEALVEDPDAWDLLVTDFDMPGMTGAELTGRARAIVPRLPVVLVTALAGAGWREGATFDAVLPKPVGREALVIAVETAILARRDKV